MLTTILCTLALAVPLQGADDNDPRMIGAYEKLVAFLRDAPSYALEVRVDWKTEGDGGGQSGTNLYSLRVKRPGKFRIEVKPGGVAQATLIVVGDGTTVTSLYTPKALYSQDKPVGPIEGLKRNTLLAQSLDGSLIDTLMRPDLVEIASSHATGGKHVGVEPVDGQSLDHYHLRWRSSEEDLWIGPEAEPLPRKLVARRAIAVGEGAAMTLITTATLKWKIGEDAPEATFTISLPENARKVDDLYTALSEGDTAALIGKPAPAVEGLAKHQGQRVVVVVFWASWAAACKPLLAHVEAVSREHEPDELAIVPINVGEDAKTVNAFLMERAASLKSVLDRDGQAVRAYGVSSVPITVVVGKDGTVQAVHRGIEPGFRETLTREVAALRRGQPLAGR